MLSRFKLYLVTFSYLKPQQIYFLPANKIRRLVYSKISTLINRRYDQKVEKRIDSSPQALDFGESDSQQLWGRTDHRLSFDDPKGSLQFTFLNKELQFNEKINWYPDGQSFLWTYNLHYFEYAYDLAILYSSTKDERYYKAFKRIVSDWIENNQLASGIGWDAYPTSLRIVAWIKAYSHFSDRLNVEFKNLFLKNLYKQALFLRNNIEYHLQNNHVIENARALFLAGVFFKDIALQNIGPRILLKELKHQVLPDGGQFELCPMYHAVVMLCYLDFVNVSQQLDIAVPDWVHVTLQKMADFYSAMQMPDHEIAFFNDSAKGMTVSSERLVAIFQHAGFAPKSVGCQAFPQSGYYILVNENSKVIFDCGPLGPDYQPGHGHCDCLSYVWAFKGKRIVIDSGVDDYYGNSAWRRYFRSTAAHNTATVDGVEQSEMWGNFRVARRARPLGASINNSGDLISVQGAHDGFYRLAKRVKHERKLDLTPTRLTVVDRFETKAAIDVQNFIHFAPEFTLAQKSYDTIILNSSDSELELRVQHVDSIKIIQGSPSPLQGWHSHEYGHRQSHPVVVLSAHLSPTDSSMHYMIQEL